MPTNPFNERQRGLTGSVVVFQGPSGTGKSHEASECWLNSGMLTGGVCFALAPTSDINSNVRSYLKGYERQVESHRNDNRRNDSEESEKRLEFMRSRVRVYDNVGECFEAIKGVIAHLGDGRPQFSLLIDEAAVARKESSFLSDIGPLLRNLRGKGYLTLHRGMAMPPQIRAVCSGRVLWRSSDGTGDEELNKEIEAIRVETGSFEYSPVMGDTPKEKQFYRGVRYTANGVEKFEYNPNLSRRPDWLLLPSLPTVVSPRVLR